MDRETTPRLKAVSSAADLTPRHRHVGEAKKREGGAGSSAPPQFCHPGQAWEEQERHEDGTGRRRGDGGRGETLTLPSSPLGPRRPRCSPTLPPTHTHTPLSATSWHAALDPYALFRNPHFTDADWARSQGWRRLLPRSFASVFRILAWYWPPLACELAASVAVCGYEALARQHGWPSLAARDLIAPLSLTSFLLGLLIVFRTNEAYGRWWEARKLWGGLAADARTLARRAADWSTRGGHPPSSPALAATLRWAAAAPVALALRVAACDVERGVWASSLLDVLPPTDAAALAASPNPPADVATALGAAVASLPGLDGPLLAALDAGVAAYSDRAVAADRLRRQPIPTAYTRNTGRFMTVWLLFLPVALFERFHFVTPAPAMVVAFFLLALDNVAAQLEQPHSVLPLDDLVRAAVDGVTGLPAWAAARPQGGV